MPAPILSNLFTALAANGNTAAVSVQAGLFDVDVFVGDSTTWGSGTLKLQHSPDAGTTWLDVASASWTSGTARLTTTTLRIAGSGYFRLNLAGATSPSITPQLVIRRIAFRDVLKAVFTANATPDAFSFGYDRAVFTVMMYGTWGSGTLKLMQSEDGGTTWYTVSSKTADGLTMVSTNQGSLFKYVLTGATSPALTALVF